MIITLFFEINGFQIDIKVNREQKIEDTLAILYDGGIIPLKIGAEDNRIFSARQEKYIDVKKTYEQEEIYNGDCLSIN